ncbi:MAG: hypothetical protein ACT4P1_10255 [Sporichthyaceae bacterium]
MLIGNDRLRVTWFNDFLRHVHGAEVEAAMPLWARNSGGSIYLRTQ